MASELIQNHREEAEIVYGEDACKESMRQTLVELGLPNGLLPMKGVEEVGFNRKTGFVWLKLKQSTEQEFQSLGKTVWYDQEVTAFVEPLKMKDITGVKSKEFFMWITVSEISINDPSSHQITFSIPAGLSMSYPFSAFEETDEEEAEDGGEEEEEDVTKE